jgi:TolB-like protein/DNA-binding winged helix-turn-helix (wHTH) protein/Tfp pilus assembly protein PilF
MPAAPDTALQIGEWRVDPSLDQIARAGQTLKLEPRAMGVLVCLAQRAGQVVSVDQLLAEVWTDVIVTPDSVYQAVAGLRKALGDDPKEPTYIANVPRRGYRLVAPVTSVELVQVEVASDAITDDSSAQPTGTASSVSRATALRPLVVLFVVAALGAMLFLGRFWVQGDNHGQQPGAGATASRPHPQSVAVLPFVDLSDTRDQQYFADGLTEEFVERLAQIPSLHVVARSSSSFFRGRPAPMSEIAKTLSADYLLQGSVRKSGPMVRITAHLVRAPDGYEMWSETYDRPLTDVFKVQDAIAGTVVQVLKISLLTGPAMNGSELTTNADAHMEYLRALSYQNNATGADYDAAESHLHAALLLDPQFAAAWALLSEVMVWKFEGRAASPDDEVCARARAAANRGLQLNPTLVISHRAMGIVRQSCDRDLAAAGLEFDRALARQPDNSMVLMSQAWLRCDRGQHDQAIEFARRATEMDPLNSWTYAALGGVALYFSHSDEAEAALRRAVDIDSSAALVHSSLAIALLTNHRPVEAVAESEREPDPQIRAMVLPIVLDAAGRRTDSERELAALKLRYGTENPDWVGLFYACRGDARQAVPWLRAYAAHHAQWMGYQPYLQACLRSLESDPGYQAFETQMKQSETKHGWPPLHCDPWWG